MIETIHINWLLLAAPFLLLLGAGMLLALVGVMEFLNASRGVRRGDFLQRSVCKSVVIISLALVVIGVGLYQFRLPAGQLILVEIKEPETGARWEEINGSRLFLPHQLKMDGHNKSHVLNNKGMKDNTMAMFWDGYIRTPFLRFKKGGYAVEFLAKGSRAEGEYSRLKVEFESPGEHNYLVVRDAKYIELSSKMAGYRMDFNIPADTIGRVRITYFNDIYIPETKKGRDVWLKNLKISNNSTL
jgi:hypothetical protein